MADALVPIHGKEGVVAHTIVDEESLPLVSQYRWNLHSTGYAMAYVPKHLQPEIGKGFIRMSRLLRWDECELAEGKKEVDHINHDILDNRLCNLRVVTKAENMANLKPLDSNKSGYPGVWYDKKKGRWSVQVRKDGKYIVRTARVNKDEAIALAKSYRENHVPTSPDATPLPPPPQITMESPQ